MAQTLRRRADGSPVSETIMQIRRFKAHFAQRADRSRFLLKEFGTWFGRSLLDVGCFEAPLRSLVSDVAYTGVDFAGNPDVHLNLETVDRLPFDAAAFDCAMSIEVLEHLDNLHAMVPELFRVARQHVIISLPNCWRDARVPIERGRSAFAHYGLPIERPVDRHKWFMSFTQVRDFFVGISEKYGWTIVDLASVEQPRPVLVRALRHLRYPGEAYDNRYQQTCICVFEKPAA